VKNLSLLYFNLLVKVLEAERVRLALLQEKIKEVLTMLRTLNAMVSTLIKNKIKFSSLYKEIQKGAVAKSYMTNSLPHDQMFAHFLIY
jgi:hypothetical protein